VFTDGTRSMGLLVEEIVDIVEDRLSIEMSGKRPGYVGSAIVAGKSTDIVDTAFYLTQAYPDWFGAMDRSAGAKADAGKRLLLVDDSPFFRNLLAPLLSTAGYEVTTAESGDRPSACANPAVTSTSSSAISRCPGWTVSSSARKVAQEQPLAGDAARRPDVAHGSGRSRPRP